MIKNDTINYCEHILYSKCTCTVHVHNTLHVHVLLDDHHKMKLVLLSSGNTDQFGEGSFDVSQLKSSTLSQLFVSELSPEI